jgi:hypothetical protein
VGKRKLIERFSVLVPPSAQPAFLFGGDFMDLTKDWMEDQILKLELDLAEAERSKVEAKTWLDRAKADYARARDAAEEASELIRYFRRELELARRTKETQHETHGH